MRLCVRAFIMEGKMLGYLFFGMLVLFTSFGSFASTKASAQAADAVALEEMKRELAALRARIHVLEQREASTTSTRSQQDRKKSVMASPVSPGQSITNMGGSAQSAYGAAMPLKAPPVKYVSSGFYFRGDIGGTYKSGDKFSIDGAGHSTNPLDTFSAQVNLNGRTDSSTSLYASAGIGYRFSPAFRSDATVSFMPQTLGARQAIQTSTEGGLIFGLTNISPPFTQVDLITNTLSPALHVQSTVAMANGYFDFAGVWPNTFQTIQPYLSAGVGASFNRLPGTTVQMTIPPVYGTGFLIPVSFNSHTQTEFAWSLGAGVGIRITDNVMLDFAYKYIDLGEVTAQGQTTTPQLCAINCPASFVTNWTVKDRLKNNVLSVGFRAAL